MNSTSRSLAFCILSFALIAYALGCGSEQSSQPDTTAPAAIMDLGVEKTGCDSVSLAWTATGDDGAEGKATSYDVRYLSETITEANWASATQCQGEPAPKAAGQAETFTIGNLVAGTTYHFACKALDDEGNASDLSNNCSTTVGSAAIAWVNDGMGPDEDWVTSATQLQANWADAACVEEYQYAIGTTQGGTDVLGWTSSGSQTAVTCTGLSLSDGQAYYFSVRGVLGGTPGTPTDSDGITVDINVPDSQVDELPEEVSTLVFMVGWSGADVTSGIKEFDIQVSSDGGGSWGDWLAATSLTAADFTGINGNTYHFRSRAHDNAGNVEAYPAVSDAYTTVNLATGLQVDWVNDGLADDADWTTSGNTLSANWPAVSGAGSYEYAVGTTQGGTDFLNWTSAGTQTSVTLSPLSLVSGQIYYVSVRVVVGVARGIAVTSDGITVDTGTPSSSVNALDATTATVAVSVTWSGADAVSGVSHYDIQVKDNDGPWDDWLTGTTLTSSDFFGVVDHTYYFRSRAHDVAGNTEDYPTDADAYTCVTCSYAYSLQWGQEGTGDGDFNHPFNVAVDAFGNVYVAESDNCRVQVFDPYGNFLHKWGGQGDGDGQFMTAAGVAIDDSGYVYVTDFSNDRVQKFTAAGVFVTKWGSYGAGDDQLHYPRGISVDDSFYVYVAEQGNERIHKYTSDGATVAVWGGLGTGDGQFSGMMSVAVAPSGNVYAVDAYNNRIQEFTSRGTFVRKWGSYGPGDSEFRGPNFIAVDASGHVYVTDGNNHRVQRFTADGRFLNKWGSFGTGDGEFDGPLGIAVGPDGSVYVTDLRNYRVQRFTPTCP